MKTPITPRSIALTLSAVVALITLSAVVGLSARAGDLPDKGAVRLTQRAALVGSELPVPTTPASAPRSQGDRPSCQTVRSAKLLHSPKGAEVLQAGGQPDTRVAIHGCDGCSTSVAIIGHGKARTERQTHSCSFQSLASANCCR